MRFRRNPLLLLPRLLQAVLYIRDGVPYIPPGPPDGAPLHSSTAGGSSSSSESDSEPEPEAEAPAAAGRQQQEQQPAAGAGQGSSDEGSESEGDEQEGHHVPAHLRWRPELTLPGMGPQQQRQRGGSAHAGAAAAAAAAAPGVHVVRRGGKDSLHVPPPDEQVRARAARKTAPDTAGKGWFDLPATKITDEVKLDLRMLRLRWGPWVRECCCGVAQRQACLRLRS